jgi:hypothetical protein
MENQQIELEKLLFHAVELQNKGFLTIEELRNFKKILKKISDKEDFCDFSSVLQDRSHLDEGGFKENCENIKEMISESLEGLVKASKSLPGSKRMRFKQSLENLCESFGLDLKSFVKISEFFVEDMPVSSLPTQETQNPEILTEFFFLETSPDINDFNLDIFSLTKTLSSRQVLQFLSLKSFTYWNLFSLIPKQVFTSFIEKISKGYKEIPYHNSLHAADVLQASHFFLSSTSLFSKSGMTNLHSFSLLLSAIIHDFKHPGVNNNFLIRSQDKLALRYNDESVLENFHLSEAFKLLKIEKFNVLGGFKNEEKEFLRKTIIFLVISTDMAKHQQLLNDVQKKLVRKNDLNGEKMMILASFLHLADLSNTLRPFHVCEEWGRRVNQEFFLQGDKERDLGLPVSPFCDRFSVNIAKSQEFFINLVMIPFIVPICREVEELKFLYGNARKNLENWRSQQFPPIK